MAGNVHVCVDLGNENLKIGIFSKKGKKSSLTHALVEKTGVNMSELSGEAVAVIVNKILECLSKAMIDARSAIYSLSLPGQVTFCRLLRLPVVERSKIPQIVQYEAQQQVPFLLSEVIWDYRVLGNPDPEHLHVMLVAVRQEVILTIISAFERQGMEVARIEASPIASYNCIARNVQAVEDTVAVMNIGARSTNLVIQAPNTLWVRTMTVGEDLFLQEVRKGVRGKEQHERPVESAAEKDSGFEIPAPALEIASKRLLAEITRSVGFYNSQFNSAPIKKIYLAGGGSMFRGLDEMLSGKLAVDVERILPFQAVDASAVSPQEQLLPALFCDVAGLAAELTKGTRMTFNLLPKAYLARRAVAHKRNTIFLCALTALLILVSQIFYQQGLVDIEASRRKALIASLQEIRQYADEIKQYTGLAETYITQISEIKKLVSERVLWLELLEDLNKTLPQNTWMVKMTATYIQKPNSDPKLKSKGAPAGAILLTLFCKTTGTYKDVTQLSENLEASSHFRETQIRAANPPIQGIRDFIIQAEVEQ